ncbi:hypothetical protein ACH5RR_026298 [Cinchona calisaya]|uniref:Uncharacterized protein n=1 Tax=Cinchona calisaya TaxID=153742 RepID=A0ABD2Z436_9GENT
MELLLKARELSSTVALVTNHLTIAFQWRRNAGASTTQAPAPASITTDELVATAAHVVHNHSQYAFVGDSDAIAAKKIARKKVPIVASAMVVLAVPASAN